MDDSNAAACNAFHTSSLLTIQSSRAPGGLRHWNPVVQLLLPTLGDGCDTELNIFYSKWLTYLQLRTLISPKIPVKSSPLRPSSDMWSTILIYWCLSLALSWQWIRRTTGNETLRCGQFCPVVFQKLHWDVCKEIVTEIDFELFSLSHFLNIVSKYLTLL